jgi:penicillin-binding protein 2
MWRVVNDPGGTGARAKTPGIVVAGKTGTAQFWRDGQKDNHTWFVAFAPYDNPKIALAVLVQGAKAGGQVPAPIAAKLIEEILALDKGYDPGLKPLDPAVGNFKFVETIDFKDNNIPAELTGADEETSDNEPAADENQTKVSKHEGNEPDIRPEADDHRTVGVTPTPQASKPKSFFDFFRRKSNGTPQPGPSPEKKKHFLFF